MRPVNKGAAPKTYANYRDARVDLANRIGRYCSYCEMIVWNSIEVEHVIPVHNGGNAVDWENFLLSCRYCNAIKKNNNPNRQGYLWPDDENTLLAFSYHNGLITASPSLTPSLKTEAQNTIDLCGLDRTPATAITPTEADTRWLSRYEAWGKATASYKNWQSCPTKEMAEQIVISAVAVGHFSVWMEVFKHEPYLRQLFIDQFVGTSKECFDNGSEISRPGGRI